MLAGDGEVPCIRPMPGLRAAERDVRTTGEVADESHRERMM